MSTLVTGGSGRLGTALRAILPDALYPSHQELDILDADSCRMWILGHDIDTIIHCAAYANGVHAETDRLLCWDTNVTGTANLVHSCFGQRIIYISTDYVFDGRTGSYTEHSPPNPINFYGVTKLCGEMIVSQYSNYLILRVPFRIGPPWPYPAAFTDQWTSARFAPEAAKDIALAATMELTGTYHIGGPRRSIYEMATSVSPEVVPTTRDTAAYPLPADVSLDSTRWNLKLAQLSRLVGM